MMHPGLITFLLFLDSFSRLLLLSEFFGIKVSVLGVRVHLPASHEVIHQFTKKRFAFLRSLHVFRQPALDGRDELFELGDGLKIL